MRDNWSMAYALSLTKDQWTDEISERFFNDVAHEISSFPFREPTRAIVDLLSLDTDHPFHSNWKIHGVSIRDEARLFLTAVFWGVTKPFMDGREAITGVEPILDCRRDGFDTFMIGTEAVLRINNEAEVSSEILDAWTDSDKMPEDWSYDCEGCLFALVD